MERTGGRNEQLTQIAEILASGYLRLLASKSPAAKHAEDSPKLSAPLAPNPLDNRLHQRDVCPPQDDRNSFKERGLA